jgi:glycine/D-amino acid oxidase-like deaminating enzyme
MNVLRRRVVAALGGSLLAGCAPFLRVQRPVVPAIRVSRDSVTAVLVGLRPYRPSGFVVRADEIAGKRVVHNYGHGGAGITLSWGTSEQAVALAGDARDCAVLGCGAVGLATATLLQRRGADVTIYAKAIPPDTTSNIAGGKWWPFGLFDTEAVDEEFIRRFLEAARLSHRHFEALAGPRYGVRPRVNWVVHDREVPLAPMELALRHLAPDMAALGPGEHPFGDAYAHRYTTMMIEPPVYLAALVEDFRARGGRIVVRELNSIDEIATLPEPVIFNCTGLGARALFGDTELVPARGQLVHLEPQPEADYNILADRAYVFPRSDAIVCGGTFDRGDWSLEPDPETTERILQRAARACARALPPGTAA